MYGWKPYSLNAETTTARENPIVAFVAQGEWHNYHHTYAWLLEEQHSLLVSTNPSVELCSPDRSDRPCIRQRFAWDYANAELGALQQWNPAKVFIDLMAMVLWHSYRRLTVLTVGFHF